MNRTAVYALCLCVVAGPLLAHALSATPLVQLNNKTIVELPIVTLPSPGNCTDCAILPDGGLNLIALGQDNTTLPVFLDVKDAANNTEILLIAFPSADCTGDNKTSAYANFAADSVSLRDDSQFPSTLQSFAMCVDQL